MSYKTELMEQILQSQEAQQIINYVSPIYGEAYTCLWLFQVIGMQLDEMQTWTNEFADQVTPNTATWALSYWESEYNITPEPEQTIEQRRNAIISKMKYRPPMNPATMADIASKLSGLPIEIQECTGTNSFRVLVRGYTDRFDQAEDAIKQIKPAHLVYTIRMAILVQASIESYSGVAATRSKIIKVAVINL